MKKNLKVGCLLIAAAVGIQVAAPRFRAATLVERIVARVNNEIITQRQFDQQREKMHDQLAEQFSGAELDQKVKEESKNLLRDLIDQDLLVEKAKDDDIDVETDVIKRLDQIRQQYSLNSLEDLQKAVEQQGLDWEDFKDQIRRDLLMRKVIEREVGGRIILSRGDARKFFDAHKAEFNSPPGVELAEILVSTQKHKAEEAQKLAQQAYNDLQTGVRWDEVVKKYSDGPEAQQGGDIGFFKQGTVAEPIADDIKNLDTNDYTKPIETKYGYMIVKILQKRVGAQPTFDQVDEQVMNYMYNMKMQEQLRAYLLQLRKESYVRLAPGFVDSGAPPQSQESSQDFPEEQ
jgi:peptidyl-prolyl cis-trans isomerase SurA